jgi:hypothetical protein
MRVRKDKNKKTKLIEAVIERVCDGDEQQVKAMRRFFLGASMKPMSFLKQIEVIARRVQEEAPVLSDGVYIKAQEGVYCPPLLASTALATRLISQGTHRLATREEIKAHAASVAISVGEVA